MAKGITIRLYEGNRALANLSGLICLWWDSTNVYEFDTPIGRTDSATTDVDGDLVLDISNVSGLSIDGWGYLLVRKEFTDHKDSLVFQGRVQVSNITVGTKLIYNDSWVRPVDWISLGTLPTETDNKFLGLHAVWKDGPNWCALKFICSDNSQYTVDWGDGSTSENIDSDTTVYHSFDYNNLAGDTETGISEARAVTFQDTGDTVTLSNHGFDNGTEISFSSIVTTTGISTYTRYYVINVSGSTFQVSDTKGGTAKTLTNDGTGAVYLPGYRQSLVTVTPTTTGKYFTVLDLNIRHASASASEYSTGWLDICLAAPNMTSLIVGSGLNPDYVIQGLLEKFNVISNGAITDFSYMFYACYSLKSIPLLDTSSGTNFNGMFSWCNSLQSIPLLDTSSGIDLNSMFENCYSLQSVPLLDTSSGTDFSYMFWYCHSLQSIPLLDTFSGTNFNGMFYECNALQLIPLLNTSNGTDFSYMFYNCYALKSIPLLDTSSGTDFSYMFWYCYSLQSIPLLNTSNGTNFSSMFYNCNSLQLVPLLDTSSGTNFTDMFGYCYSLQKGALQETAQPITYPAGQLSPISLNEIFSYLSSNVLLTTITITGNYGAATVSLSGTTTSGSTTVTMADTTELSTNMWITGTNISSSRSVTFQDTGDTVTLNNHGIPNGTRVSFTAITSTTGLTLKTIYYIVNTQTNTFQVSDTVGGAAKTLTTDGSGTLIYENYIVSIVPNTSITLSIPASGSATNTLTSTTMNPYLATLKGWTVTN